MHAKDFLFNFNFIKFYLKLNQNQKKKQIEERKLKVVEKLFYSLLYLGAV